MTTPLDQTRADFEAKFGDVYEFSRYLDTADFDHLAGQYVDALAQAAWEAWQAAIASRAVPEGWQLVPIKPTDEMMGAVVSSMDEHLMGKDGAEAQYREDWAAMLRAAPTPPIAAKAAKETPQ